MATHKKVVEGTTDKTFIFKVSLSQEEKDKYTAAMREQAHYYNGVSKWICDHLTTMTIGEFAQYFDSEKFNPVDKLNTKTNKIEHHACQVDYLEPLISDEWKDKPMYKMFTKKFNSMHRDNILYNTLHGELCPVNPEEYTGNSLGLSGTYFMRNGYIADVISNYVSRFSNLKPTVKRHKLRPDMTDDEIVEQVVYEMQDHHIEDMSGWKNEIDYIEGRETVNQEQLERIQFLANYYKEHEASMTEKLEEMTLAEIKKFGGCLRDESNLSMKINVIKSNISISFDDKGGIDAKYSNAVKLHLLGWKLISKNEALRHCIENPAGNLVLKIEDGEMYAHIGTKTPFSKDNTGKDNVIGIDVNSKHMLLMTNAKDNGQLKGYVNIYKEAMNDPKFVAAADAETKELFADVAQYVTFCPTELELLYGRQQKQKGIYSKMTKVEEAYSDFLVRLREKFLNSGESEKRQYLDQVITIRNQEMSYCRLRSVYYQKQSEYDLGKDADFIKEHPFSKTANGISMNMKMSHIGDVIVANRNGVCNYAYKVLSSNGYNHLALEKLESSQMKKQKFLTVNSLLGYHHVLGDTDAEFSKKEVYKFKDNYVFTYDEDGKITGATLSAEGEAKRFKIDMYNLMLKTIHFAEVKDKFLQLSNNGSMTVSLVPPAFTSQMDSLTHTAYVTRNDKKQVVLVDKCRVRKTQEKHINGLNADYNAACNIAYIVQDEKFRNEFLKEVTKVGYSTPMYDTNIKSRVTIAQKLKSKKLNAVQMIEG